MSIAAMNNATLALIAQSSSLATISQNISNTSTTGYKTSQTMFSTVLSESYPDLDIFSVKGTNRTLIDQQGGINSTGNWSDLAINGEGLFVVNTQMDGSGETLFTRDGGFGIDAVDSDGDGTEDTAYLVDGNGYYLQGYSVAADGTVNTSALTSVSYKSGGEIVGKTTGSVEIFGLLDATATKDQSMSVAVYGPEVYGTASEVDSTSLELTWAPQGNGSNSWNLTFAIDGATIANPTSTVTFDGLGAMTSGGSTTLNVTWGDGSTSQMTVDISNILQLSGNTTVDLANQDGYDNGLMTGISFDSAGNMSTSYDNGYSVTTFQLPLADFVATNQLEARSGNLFAQTQASGDYTLITAGGTQASFVAGALEASTVELEDEFTKMVMTQTAYNSASKVFMIADEMVQTVANLK